VFANPLPAITASQINICEGSTVDFSGSVVGGGIGFGYAWDFGGLGSANTQNASFNFTDGTNVGLDVPVTLTVSAPNNFGANCSNTTNTIIHVYSNPDLSQVTFNTTDGCSLLDVQVANLPSNLNLLNWGDGAIDTNTGHTYVNNSSAILSHNLAIASSVTYPTIPNLVCTSLANQSISVHPSPLPAIASSATQSCEGQMIDFSASTSNNQYFGVDFSWNIGNISTSNSSNTSYNFLAGSATGTAYPIELTASQTTLGVTCSETVSSTVFIYDTPDLTPLTINTISGCSDLEVTLANLPSASNQINWGDGSVNFADSHIYTNNGPGLLTFPLTLISSSVYNVIPQLTCSATENQLISIYPTPIAQLTSSQVTICEGSNVDFTASTSNNQNSGVSYNWDFGILGTSNSILQSVTFINGSTTGLSYSIELIALQTTLGVTCSDSTSTEVFVYDTPDLAPVTYNITSGCSDLEVIISNLPTASNQINWGDGIANLATTHTYVNNGSSLLSHPINITSTTTYGTIPQLNCVATSTQNIVVYPSPLPQIFSSAINICEGESVDFIASTANNQNAGVSFLWDFGVLGTSNNSNSSIEFLNGNSLGLPNQVLLTAFQNTSGTICSTTVTEDVIVFDTPDLSTALFSEINSCSPLLVSITNLPTSTYTYDWGDGTTTSNPNHIYINQGTSPLNYNININATTFYQTLPQLICSATSNQIVQAFPQPFAAFTMSPEEGCLYDPVTTTLQNTSLNAFAPYIWNYNGNSYTTNGLNYIATFNTSGPNPVELVVTNQFGCTDSVTNNFMIYDLPTVTLNAIDDDLCNGATAEFVIDGTGISTSTWDFGDGTTLNLLNPTSLVHYYNEPGTYSITAIVTNIYGCSDTITFPNEVIIRPKPIASFTTNTTTADIVYPYFEFYDNSANATNYYWNFGDSNWSNDINPNHYYQTVGNYLVELTVSNDYNCFDVTSQIVTVEGIVVHVPNAFTPLDYNGVNDVFRPTFSSTEGIEFYEMIIYNRWGDKIFQTNSIDEAWIGNSRENETGNDNYYAQNDTYIYTVRYRKKARANDPQPDQIITGHVTIIR
jgi:PKD repeat protein